MSKQWPLFLDDEDFVFRAITKPLAADGSAGDTNFRLRPGETTLSVALTPEKAMGTLKCKGYTSVRVGDVRALGLRVVRKADDDDPELWEIDGIPPGDPILGTTYALAIAKKATQPVRITKG